MFDVNRLEKHGIKPSITRIKIFDYLLEHDHPSVDEIYQALKLELPTLSKTTVYNVLNLFQEHHLVSTVALNPKELRYEINHQPHTHFQCVNCGEIYDLPYVPIDYQTIRQEGFEFLDHSLVVKGICSKCKKVLS